MGSNPIRVTKMFFVLCFKIDTHYGNFFFHVYLFERINMASRISQRISDEEFIKICNSSETMAKACAKMKLHFNSFKKRAILLNCYKPNQAGIGIKKRGNGNKIDLQEILSGLHPYYQTNKLKNRLFKEEIKKRQCEICGLTKWLEKPISFELDHKDGDKTNHKLLNLRIVCPNCHSQTETYRSKNKK